MNKETFMNQFTWERELGYTLPKDKFLEILTPKEPWSAHPLVIKRTYRIEQYWLNDFPAKGKIFMRSRLRKTIYKDGREEYEHTTKYELTPSSRIECNAPLSRLEYEVLEKVLTVPSQKTEKTRIEFWCNELQESEATNTIDYPLYSADIYPNQDTVRIEIEFSSREEVNKFTPPKWITDNEIKEKQ